MLSVFVYRHPERTLTDEEVNRIQERLADELKKNPAIRFKWRIRETVSFLTWFSCNIYLYKNCETRDNEMEQSQFEKLEEKVSRVLEVIKDLKAQKQSLSEELNAAKEKIKELESKTPKQNEDLTRLRSELSAKADNMAKAGEKIQNLITKLENENLEALSK